MKYATTAAATFALISSASAHLFMQVPKPIQGNAIKNPLDPSGSDFPCHGVAPPGAGGVDMAVGSQQDLIFDSGASHENTAVHGGGSCQVSITYETDPAKLKDPNSWRVLYSIEGGCPTNSRGNLADSYQGPSGGYSGSWQCSDATTNGYDCVNAFRFTIPEGVKTGQATLAWTWFNTIGNREMYMNCAAVNIQGGASDASGLQDFPPMFVANLASVGGGTCKTTEMTNVGFPNPGKYAMKKVASPNMRIASASDYPLKTPDGCPTGSYATGAPQPSTSAAAPSQPATTSAAAPAPSSDSAPSSQAPVPSQPSTTLQTSAAAPGTTGGPNTSTIRKRPVATKTTKSKKPKKTKAGSTGTGAVSLPMPSATAGSCAAGSVSCIGVNSVVCVDDNHFGICDYNGCAIAQAVAPGTMCSQGAITWAKSKNKRHLARHIHGAQHLS